MPQGEFEREFNARTRAYHPEYRADDRAVVVVVSDEANCEPGHALLVALVNQLARAHRRLVLVGNLDRPLQCADHFGFKTVSEATAGFARAINPFIDVQVASDVPSAKTLISLGVGNAGSELDLGADGWLALLGNQAHV